MKTTKELIEDATNRYKDYEKDDNFTIETVSGYLNTKHGHISTLFELLANITTGRGRSKINYEIIEEEYNKHRPS